MASKTVIHWFRQDLRVEDNPALHAAAQHGLVLPVYIYDDAHPGKRQMGAASRVWLHHAIQCLQQQLKGRVLLFEGDAIEIISQLVTTHDIKAVYWNRCYEPWRIKRDTTIKQNLIDQGIEVESFNGSLLWEPWTIKNQAGEYYKKFTPFYRKGCLAAAEPRKPMAKPESLKLRHIDDEGLPLEAMNLLPEQNWDVSMMEHWTVGEEGALQRLDDFLRHDLADYKVGRDFPAKRSVSRLSPHLHFGSISPHQIWHTVRQGHSGVNVDHFCSELAWREFSYYLLYHFPQLPKKNFQAKFDQFPWVKNKKHLRAWQQGKTGYPIVDAGMRELWQTGYMHNRVRMIVASFLVKNLMIDWREGERWFWDCLVDADEASNCASWQWVAGCGTDAAPYFRIFNPILQGKKFDPEGVYIKQYVPELEALSEKYLFAPWEAPADALQQAGIKLGRDYPQPIVDIKETRERALSAFKQL